MRCLVYYCSSTDEQRELEEETDHEQMINAEGKTDIIIEMDKRNRDMYICRIKTREE
jgi:hypothetical protein